MTQLFSEDSLIEQPAIALLGELGWETANCYDETFGPEGTLGRETSSEVVLLSRLRPPWQRLNPDLPPEALTLAIEELTRDRSLMSPAHANREVYQLLKDGVKVTYRDAEGMETVETVHLIDWENPDNNDFFLASQFWVIGRAVQPPPRPAGLRQRPAAGLRRAQGRPQAPGERLPKTTCATTKTPSRTCSGTTPSSSSPTAARPASAASPPPGSTSTSGRRSTARARKALSPWRQSSAGCANRPACWTSSRTSPCSPRSRAGLHKLVAKNHQYLGVNNAFECRRSKSARTRAGWASSGTPRAAASPTR